MLSFTKVKATIDKFLGQLRAEQQHEVEHKNYCDKAIYENELSTTDVLNRINAIITKQKSIVEMITNEIDDLTKSPSSDDKQLKEAQGVRKEERSDSWPAETKPGRDGEHAGAGHRYPE